MSLISLITDHRYCIKIGAFGDKVGQKLISWEKKLKAPSAKSNENKELPEQSTKKILPIASLIFKEMPPILFYDFPLQCENNRANFHFLSQLPDDFYPIIGSYLDLRELARANRVSKGFIGLVNYALCLQVIFQKKIVKDSFSQYHEVFRKFITYNETFVEGDFGANQGRHYIVERLKHPISDILPYKQMFDVLDVNLEVLSLATLPITDEEIDQLGDRCLKLKRIDLSRCLKITDNCLDILVQKFKSLQAVSFYGCTKITVTKVIEFDKQYRDKIQHHLSGERPADIKMCYGSELETLKILDTPNIASPENVNTTLQLSHAEMAKIRTNLQME